MNLLDELKQNRIILDGAMGTMLQNAGLQPGELPELWNVTHPEEVTSIHKQYFDAGSNVVVTNTFGANSLHYTDEDLKLVIEAAVRNARNAAIQSKAPQNKYVALDVGPFGRLLQPFGDLSFEEAVSIFKKTISIGAACDIDLVFIETITDCYEMKAAVVAAKEACKLPIFASNAYTADGKLLSGAEPSAMVFMLESLGVDAIGANCSFGPETMLPIARQFLKYASVPVLIKPNAGIPSIENGHAVFNVEPSAFSSYMKAMAEEGVRIMGGCCGTTPAHIAQLKKETIDIPLVPVTEKHFSAITSYGNTVLFGEKPVLIGERINPTGKKRFQQALREHDLNFVLKEGLAQEDCGAHVLDVNVGLPDIHEDQLLPEVVTALQGVTALPLQIDTTNIAALEAALRLYNGKALINSVNGKQESMDAVFPVAKKYGGMIVALTLDESGIPKTAEARVAVAEKILHEAEKYGISAKDLIFDPLALAVSAENDAAVETLRSLEMLHQMGLNTSLGVSNVSFGLPAREVVNSHFFALALDHGLSAAIMNPHSQEMMKTYKTSMMLHGKDEACASYIEFASSLSSAPVTTVSAEKDSLQDAIIRGMKEKAGDLCKALLLQKAPMDIVNEEIIPALDCVGKEFEAKRVFLPQLLMSADAAGNAFEAIKTEMAKKGVSSETKGKFVIATVKGDIHDIGKNIVKALLENYGYQVIDLGRDVDPEKIAATVVAEQAPLCGLSALMTTTVPSMEATIKLLREKAPWCKIVTGGAVLTEDYVKIMGADCFGKDAMETVRYAEKICIK